MVASGGRAAAVVVVYAAAAGMVSTFRTLSSGPSCLVDGWLVVGGGW